MRGSSLPADWQPTSDDASYGRTLGFSTDQMADMAEQMHLWAGANRNRAVARKSDWSLTFRGWMRREAQRRPWALRKDSAQTSLNFGPRSTSRPPEPVPVDPEVRAKVAKLMTDLANEMRAKGARPPRRQVQPTFERPTNLQPSPALLGAMERKGWKA